MVLVCIDARDDKNSDQSFYIPNLQLVTIQNGSHRSRPAEYPLAFDAFKRPVEDMPEYLRNEGLDVFK